MPKSLARSANRPILIRRVALRWYVVALIPILGLGWLTLAGFIPGSFQAVYNGSKAFLNSFSFALRNELKDTAVTVTCLMPGPTDTEFFRRADLLDTKVGTESKDDPAEVAQAGVDVEPGGVGRGPGGAGRGDPNRLAGALGMPPWKVRKAQQQVRHWSPATLAAVFAVAAEVNADVKGAAADVDYALERAVLRILA